MTDIALVKELLALLDNSSATTIEIRRGFTTYRVSREVAYAGGHAPVHPAVAAAMAQAPGAAPVAPAAAPEPAPTRLIEVKSPMVGTFYKAPEPGAEPYVKVGSRVSAGQMVCIIEAMKIMNEIESEVQGVIRDVAVESGQPLEFGQTLFRVDPHG
jgi:acetyl-CoA carboxylase biotin carboxyl carrier protein